MIGNNLKAYLEHLEKRMRDAAANLDFETAARLRDEIKRLRETELAIADDPLQREAELLSPASGREKGRHNKGRALHRALDDSGISPLEGEMSAKRTEGVGADGLRRKRMSGTVGTTPPPASGRTLPSRGRDGSLFAKPSLDDMGPGTDTAKPAGAVSRSLFRKQTHLEAHESDFGVPGEGGKSLFRKNNLDEMTVRRTEKPVGSMPPKQVEERRIPDDPKPLVRERSGIGSYEDATDVRRHGRRPKKSGRPGH